MRNYILFIILTTFSAQAGLSRLEALSQIETGDNDAAVGKAGEVSRYQIKPWIWRLYSQSQAYSDRNLSSQVAAKHLAELTRLYEKQTRRPATDFDIYVLWNAGPTYYARIRFSQGRVHPVIRERAVRFANLCQRAEPVLARARAPLQQPSASTVPPADPAPVVSRARPVSSEPLWPIFSGQQTAGLIAPSPVNLPVAGKPAELAPVPIQPAFAIGGVKVR